MTRVRLLSHAGKSRRLRLPLRPGPPLRFVTPALLLAAALLFVLVPAPAQAHPSSFRDVSETESIPHHNAIEYMAAAKVVSGYANGTFKPYSPILRGQAAKILVGWRQVPLVSGGTSFTDLDSTYAAYVRTVVNKGWILGLTTKTFGTYQPLTREQMALAMVRALGWKSTLTSAEITQILSAFPDAAKVSPAARAEVALAVQKGLFEGTADGRLDPLGNLTRAQFCLVAYRAELKHNLRAQVTDIRVDANYDPGDGYGRRTRVVLDLSRAPGTVKASTTAGLLYIDIAGAIIDGDLSKTIGTTEVKSVFLQQSRSAARTIRMNMSLARYQRFRVMSIGPSGTAGYRVVIDVYARAAAPGLGGSGPPLICIDPGHGGSDPGATGVNGTKEKTVNLAIALKLRDELKKIGLAVVLTREYDAYPTLQWRCDIANKEGATLFVSIHNNWISNSSTTGTETFYQGNPAVDAQGKLLAQAVQRNLVSTLGSKDRGAKIWSTEGELYVLKNTNMPAVLTEIGFLSNSTEEAQLKNAGYQTKAAQAITKGITDYLGWSTAVTSN